MVWIKPWTAKWNEGWKGSFAIKNSVVGPAANSLAWYDFSNTTYLNLSSTSINSAIDRSGHGNNTGTQTTTKRPVYTTNQQNGLSVAVFTGSSVQTLALPSALYTLPGAANEIYIIGKRNVEDASLQALSTFTKTGTTRQSIFYEATAGNVDFRNDAGDIGTVSSTGNTNTNFQIFHAYFIPTNSVNIETNNTHLGSNTNGAAHSDADAGFIGSKGDASLYLTGGIGEIIYYNRTLSTAERSQTYTYLSNKWGIP